MKFTIDNVENVQNRKKTEHTCWTNKNMLKYIHNFNISCKQNIDIILYM